jgi:2-dehydro-3-deoxygluconokinase
MISRVREAYPNAAVYANTLREVISANAHLWGAMLWTDGKWHVEAPREIPVLDRIGGGDSFVSGLMYGILKGWEPEKWLQFGWASGALTVTLEGDYAMPADEKQIWDIYKGNARVPEQVQ